MTATVEQIQSDLRRLLEHSPNGEEVLITRNGRAVAKLIILPHTISSPERQEWLRRLAELRQQTATSRPSRSSEEILDELRSDRG